MKDRHVFARRGPAAGHASPVLGHRRFGRSRGLPAALAAVLFCWALAAASHPARAAAQMPTAGTEASWPTEPPTPDVLPSLTRNLVAHYDFEHPVTTNPAQERDQGFSGTTINLVNGGAAMRVPDGAHRGSATSMQTRQVNPTVAGNDDWKAGIYSPTGVPSLNAFNRVRAATVMGWFKTTGQNPSPNSNTANPDDFFGAVGLAGILSGDSDGHAVRALLELINVSGELRLVALGRRIDGSSRGPRPTSRKIGRQALAPCHCPDDEERLGSLRDRVWQRGVRRFLGQILVAGEEPHERPALVRDVVADGAAQHRVPGFERVEHLPLGGLALDVEAHLALDAREHPEMGREHDSDHGSVWTSTESTAGRSRTIGAQVSPASGDAYTCPPVVPKYTPQGSNESTAIASRSTLT
jgi:hypothetical protein